MAIRNTIVTLFPSITKIHKPDHHSLLEVLDGIKAKSNPFQYIIKEIRKAGHDEANNLKLALPPICFSGKFNRRDDSGLMQYSQLVCLDIDDVNNLISFKNEMQDVPYIYACFISPSGKGLKILVFHDCTDSTRHGDIYWHIGKELGLTGRTDLKFDTHCSNISRACFFSYDPNLIINPEVEPLHIDISLLKPVPGYTSPLSPHDSLPPVISNPIPSDMASLKKYKESLVNTIEEFERFHSFYPGVRNTNLNILVCKLRSKGYPEDLVSPYLQLYYGGHHRDFTTTEIKNCVTSVYGFKP